MRQKSEKTEKMISAIKQMFDSLNGSTTATARQLVPEVEKHLGQDILDWDGKPISAVIAAYKARRLSYFLQHAYRQRKDGRSERVVVKAGKVWIHKPLYKQYLLTLGKDGLEAALKFLIDAANALEPNIEGNKTIRDGYLLTFQQLTEGMNLEQLSLFANPDIEKEAS